MARATRSLPVHESRRMGEETGASRATRHISFFSRSIVGERPSNSGNGSSDTCGRAALSGGATVKRWCICFIAWPTAQTSDTSEMHKIFVDTFGARCVPLDAGVHAYAWREIWTKASPKASPV